MTSLPRLVKLVMSISLGILGFCLAAAITVTLLLGIDLWRRRR